MDKISDSWHGVDKQDEHSGNCNTNANTNTNTNQAEAKQEPRHGHIVLLGYGDVGKPVARTLRGIGAQFVVVDKYSLGIKQEGMQAGMHDANHDDKQGCGGGADGTDASGYFDFVVGDCVEEDVLISADIESASVIIVALNNDTNVIYSTLVSRTLNPDAIILARANSSKSIDKIYKAGADYVASLPIIAGQMLAKLTRSCTDLACDIDHESTMLYEGIEIEKYHIHAHSKATGKTIRELDVRAKYGCTIIGVEIDGHVNVEINPDLILRDGMTVALIGYEKQVHNFKADYGVVS